MSTSSVEKKRGMRINQVRTVSLTQRGVVQVQIWPMGFNLVRFLLTFPKSLVIHQFAVVEPVMVVLWCYKILVVYMEIRSEIMTFG